MVRFKRVMCNSGARRDAGYTLMEVLVAMAVMSVATYLIVGAFTGSMELGDRSITSSVAAAFAEEQLSELKRNPSAFTWPDDAALANGALAKIAPKNADAAKGANAVTPPATLPADAGAKNREQTLYSKLSWEAHARLAKPDSLVYEVTVSVKWAKGKRDEIIALTTALPKTVKGGGA